MGGVPEPQITRRLFAGGGAALLLVPGCSQGTAQLPTRLDAIEADTGGRIGVAAQNLATGEMLLHRPDERFAMCSTFKWLLGALVLARVDAGDDALDWPVAFSADDLVFYSPVLEQQPPAGAMTVAALCEATITTSDNTAANLLLNRLGGPRGFTEQVRLTGDKHTRLDRMETALNENKPGDPRDTTTPAAMLGLMRHFLFEDGLSRASRRQLRGWMIASQTGFERLRAGIPEGWRVGDKTGTSANDANNDVAFALPPENTGPEVGEILIVSYTNAPEPLSERANVVHADIAREAFRVLVA